MTIREPANADEFDAILKENADALVVIDFYATWCGPCQDAAPEFHKLFNEFTSVVFLKVEVDRREDIESRFDIKCMPTFVFMKRGAQIDLVEGFSEDELREIIKKFQ